MKYNVVFFQNQPNKAGVDFCIIASGLDLEAAVQFALNLHRSSNTVHCISVEIQSKGEVTTVIRFERKS